MNARIQSIESCMKCGSTVTGSGMANAPVLGKNKMFAAHVIPVPPPHQSNHGFDVTSWSLVESTHILHQHDFWRWSHAWNARWTFQSIVSWPCLEGVCNSHSFRNNCDNLTSILYCSPKGVVAGCTSRYMMAFCLVRREESISCLYCTMLSVTSWQAICHTSSELENGENHFDQAHSLGKNDQGALWASNYHELW